MNAKIVFTCHALASFGLVNSLSAGPEPFPNEMSYPNIIAPRAQVGTYGADVGAFNNPSCVLAVSRNEFIIADTNNSRVVNVNVINNETTQIDYFTDKVERPISIAKSDVNKLYVLDGSKKVVVSEGFYLDLKELVGPSVDPVDIDIVRDKLIVTDAAGCHAYIVDIASKSILRKIGGFGEKVDAFKRPHGVTHDEDGNIYISDSENSRIVKYDSDFNYDTTWGIWGSYSGLMATPSGLSYSNGTLYVADRLNHRIQAFDTAGNYKFQWGRHPVNSHEGNGRMHYPYSLSAFENCVAVLEPFENRFQVYDIKDIKKVTEVNDSAWWEKATRFHYGTKAAMTPACFVMVSEPDTHSVLLFATESSTAKPVFKGRVGGYGSSLGKFKKATGVAFHPTKPLVYVSDNGNRRIQVFALRAEDESLEDVKRNIKENIFKKSDPSKEYKLEFLRSHDFSGVVMPMKLTGTNHGITKGFVDVGGMTVDSNGSVYIADPANSRVVKLDEQLNIVDTIGGYGNKDGELNKPLNVALSKDEKRLYVVDAYNFRVQVFDPDTGQFLFKFGHAGDGPGGFSAPFGVTCDKHGNSYVTDTGFHTIQKFDSDGKHLATWGGWGTDDGLFYKPKGIASSEDDKLIVLDFGNHRGQIFDIDGSFVEKFGLGEGGKNNMLYKAQ